LRADACTYFFDVILKVVRWDTLAEEEQEQEDSRWERARWAGGSAGGSSGGELGRKFGRWEYAVSWELSVRLPGPGI
jgi:hypothetical protein